MAQPIKRDTGEAMEEAAYSAGKFALGAYVGTFLAGAAAVVATAGLASFMFSANLLTGGAGTVVGLAAIGTGVALASTYGTIAAAAGGLLGLVKGANRVERENRLYAEKSKEKLMGKEAEMAQVHNQAMQMGFQAGVEQGRAVGQQEGAQMVLAKLQEHAQQENATAAPAAHHHHEEKAGKSFAAAITAEREKATGVAAGAQIG